MNASWEPSFGGVLPVQGDPEVGCEHGFGGLLSGKELGDDA